MSYDMTSAAEESEGDEFVGEETQRTKRLPKKKSFSDFVSGNFHTLFMI